MRVLGWCLMPNHFHIVLQPHRDGDLGPWMQWLLTTHVRRHQYQHGTIGRIWQGRFKAFPIQADEHLLAVRRYVRAGLVGSAREWAWSSGAHRAPSDGSPVAAEGVLAASPVDFPQPWSDWVDQPLTDAELVALRVCAQRERPFGDAAWVRAAAALLGLESTLVPRGRPRRTL